MVRREHLRAVVRWLDPAGIIEDAAPVADREDVGGAVLVEASVRQLHAVQVRRVQRGSARLEPLVALHCRCLRGLPRASLQLLLLGHPLVFVRRAGDDCRGGWRMRGGGRPPLLRRQRAGGGERWCRIDRGVGVAASIPPEAEASASLLGLRIARAEARIVLVRRRLPEDLCSECIEKVSQTSLNTSRRQCTQQAQPQQPHVCTTI